VREVAFFHLRAPHTKCSTPESAIEIDILKTSAHSNIVKYYGGWKKGEMKKGTKKKKKKKIFQNTP
jgi:hypothetical protein